MALSVAHPSNFSTIDKDHLQASFREVSGMFSWGFVKAEPVAMEDSMEAALSPSSSSLSSSSPQYGNDITFTELTQANFPITKQGSTDPNSSCEQSQAQAFSSWCFKHPEHWAAPEVLDWVFYLFESEGFDSSLFCGEAYNSLTGKKLCAMSRDEFTALDPNYGARVYEVFHYLLMGANFKTPCPPEAFKTETFGNVPDFAFIECPSRVHQQRLSPSPTTTENKLSVILDTSGVKVNLDGLGLYDIDVSEITDTHMFDRIDDSDYHSGSDARSDVFEPMFSDEEESLDQVVLPESHRNSVSSTSSSDSGCESDEKKLSSRRRQPSSTKGNHLWEFVRDLLKDSRFNPSLLKWEDKEMGIFKFVQSEAVASMWGRKKNNPCMTYEKLSRAMRFCRSAGYFDSVPKDGRFPKKLCFRFGQKAHDWRD